MTVGAIKNYLDIAQPRRTEAEALARMPVEICAEARSRLINVTLTREELTLLMQSLEVAKERASINAQLAAQPTYPPRHPDAQRRYEDSTVDRLKAVTELCERVTDIWSENR